MKADAQFAIAICQTTSKSIIKFRSRREDLQNGGTFSRYARNVIPKSTTKRPAKRNRGMQKSVAAERQAPYRLWQDFGCLLRLFGQEIPRSSKSIALDISNRCSARSVL